MKKLLVIFGPTATGKTDLAIKLAKKFNGEVVACDSRQVYIGLDIGTGKYPSKNSKLKKKNGVWEVNGVNIWMYDVVSPKIQYTVANYVKDAARVIKEIEKKGKLPIVIGGTGLYLKALLEGLSNLAIPVDKRLRRELEKLTFEQLQKKLKGLSPTKWQKLNESDRQNPRRLLRSIEISTYGYIEENQESRIKNQGKHSTRLLTLATCDYLKIGLTAPREVLYKNADLRVLSRIELGMIDEAKKLQNQGVSLKRMRKLGLEYGVLADYLSGEITGMDGNNGFIKILQGKIHGYIRRQLTWFKKEKNVHWFDINDRRYINNVEMLVTSWYYGHHDQKN